MMAAARRSAALVNLVSKFRQINLGNKHHSVTTLTCEATNNYFRTLQCSSSIHTSSSLRDLSEFFDTKSNWGSNEVKVGRAWKKEELRIKSNEDLHKLWYVLLKERNMLFTMEHSAKEEYRLFPNPERIDKVEESMRNVEEVVKERDRAYWLLETGETGERPGGFILDELGMHRYRKYTQHFIPKFMNPRHNQKIYRGRAVGNFKKLMKEQKYTERKKARARIRNHVAGIFRRFPNVDMEALQQQYPEVDVEAIRREKRSRGQHEHNLN